MLEIFQVIRRVGLQGDVIYLVHLNFFHDYYGRVHDCADVIDDFILLLGPLRHRVTTVKETGNLLIADHGNRLEVAHEPDIARENLR